MSDDSIGDVGVEDGDDVSDNGDYDVEEQVMIMSVMLMMMMWKGM